MAKRYFPLLAGLLASTGYLLAQETTSAEVLPYQPLTFSENYFYSVHQIFTVPRVFQVAAHAAIDAARHSDGWGSGAGAFEMRSASSFGRAFVKENLAFGVRAVDGEDPRYTRLGQGTVWVRIRYAVGHTFMVRGRTGDYMPAYSLAANYAMPFVAQEWHPGAIHGGRELRAGTIGVASAVSTNLGREFWPDLKKKLHR